VKSYKELEVWQKAKNLAVSVYKATETMPRSEQFGLTSQMRRAAASVAANIAEGWGRGSTVAYIHFLLIARASLMELETHLIISEELKYLQPAQLEGRQKMIESIGQMLNRLIQSLRKRRDVVRSPNSELRTPNPQRGI
jgi:four helix bundle protein